MNTNHRVISKLISTMIILAFATTAMAQNESFNLNLNKYPVGMIIPVALAFGALIGAVIFLVYNTKQITKEFFELKKIKPEDEMANYMKNLTSSEIEVILKRKATRQNAIKKSALMLMMLFSSSANACNPA